MLFRSCTACTIYIYIDGTSGTSGTNISNLDLGNQKLEQKSNNPYDSHKQEPKQTPDLDQKAIDFFRTLKDKFGFFRPPEERLASREPDNVIRYLQFEKGLSENDAKAIISKWQELDLVLVDDTRNQIILRDQNQKVNENGNH